VVLQVFLIIFSAKNFRWPTAAADLALKGPKVHETSGPFAFFLKGEYMNSLPD